MKFISTREGSPSLNFEDTIMQGLAVDGGLYVPDFLPQFDKGQIDRMRKLSYQDLFFEVTKCFIDGEISDKDYKQIIQKSYATFNHKAIAPLKQISDRDYLLELFHGPTLAFKDFALQFIGNVFEHFLAKRDEKIVIIGATSGDTGSAAIHGCMRCDHAQIFILHPYERVSEIQRKQMTTIENANVCNIAIKGNFDDCQNMVKKMFAMEAAGDKFLKGKKMVAVNSINFARIMAQIVYYFYSALRLGVSETNTISFSVPTGNFGDIYAGFLAKRMGLNIGKLIIATNANDILFRFITKNDYSREQLIETISPSMNIQVSSNFERLLFDFYKGAKTKHSMAELMSEFEKSGTLKVDQFILKEIQQDFTSFAASDEITQKYVKEQFEGNDEIIDPHTATGIYAAEQYAKTKDYKNEPIVTLATAHPAKFPDAVVGSKVPHPKLPNFLEGLLEKEEKYDIIDNDLESVVEYISNKI